MKIYVMRLYRPGSLAELDERHVKGETLADVCRQLGVIDLTKSGWVVARVTNG